MQRIDVKKGLKRLYQPSRREATEIDVPPMSFLMIDGEGPTIVRLHQFVAQRGELAGKHHEIYLSDIRRASPSRWRTLLRQPMR